MTSLACYDAPLILVVDSGGTECTTLQKLIVDSEVRGTILQQLIVDSEVVGLSYE